MSLVTGESVGQVASQTIHAIACTDEACHMPVFRPLIGMDKTEIIEIARKIDTFETSIQPYEDCCTVFTPKHPKIRQTVKEVIETARKVTGHPIPAKLAGRRAGDPAQLIASSEKAKKILGWKPCHNDLEEIIETAWNWHKNHPDGF